MVSFTAITSFLFFSTPMEDLNMLCADCVVISCCCQCLILQILIFVLLRLPHRLVRKTKEYAKKKLQQRKKGKKVVMKREKGSLHVEETVRIHEESFRIEGERVFMEIGEHSCGCCLDEVEKVMGEFSRKGEFGFGSFWGKEEPWGAPKIVTKHQGDDVDHDGLVKYLSEMIGSLS